jgi:hypothetical protein
MKRRLFLSTIAASAAAALSSCDKAGNLLGKARKKVKDRISSATGGSADGADEALEKLVDRNADGVLFRKDQVFPSRLEVRTTRRQVIDARLHQTSAIEKRTEVVKGTRTAAFALKRNGNEVLHVIESTGFTKPGSDDADEAATKTQDPLERVAAKRESQVFRKSGSSWACDSKDTFRAATISRQIGPVFDELLFENALAPRPVWFSKRRFKPGDMLTLTGDSLQMLVAGRAAGTLELELDGFEGVDGHPCGVFHIKGSFSRKGFPDFDGTLTDEEVTIQSGKLWLSLLHPVVLREDLETVQSLTSGEKGGLVTRWQGAVGLDIRRTWKPL